MFSFNFYTLPQFLFCFIWSNKSRIVELNVYIDRVGLPYCHCNFASSALSFESATKKCSAYIAMVFIFSVFHTLTTIHSALSLYVFSFLIMQEKSEVVDVKEEAEIELVDENKVDWKGRRALKFKYGGMCASVLILGNKQ